MSEWQISTKAIFKILASAAIVFVLFKISPLLILLLLSLLIGVALRPIIDYLQRWMPHWAASALVSIGVFALLGGIVVGVIPTLTEQFSILGKRLPELHKSVVANAPDGLVSKFIDRLGQSNPIRPEWLVVGGQHLLETLADLILMLVIALYLATDGERTYNWIRAFFSAENARKIDETAKETSDIIVAYVFGQALTSLLCAVFVFAVLQILKVPGAVVLAVLAAVFDILPMLGFFLFTIPAVLFALTVSSQAALVVLITYFAYHQLEAYFLVPKIYGNRLRLSDLVVLISVLAGAYLAGIPGAILSLPIVAAYPAVERIWLVNYVGRGVVAKHKSVEESKES